MRELAAGLVQLRFGLWRQREVSQRQVRRPLSPQGGGTGTVVALSFDWLSRKTVAGVTTT